MKKIIYLIIATTFVITACHKQQPVSVTYRATAATSPVSLTYLNENNELTSITMNAESSQDIWQYRFEADQGDIVYITGHYSDIQSALELQILIDGKIYKKANSVADTIKFLTVSGVVPYNENQ